MNKKTVILVLVAIALLCGVAYMVMRGEDPDPASSSESPSTEEQQTQSAYLGSYSLTDSNYGTMVEVIVSGDTRTIIANALPNHETGEFPNSGNPNAISEQNLTYSFPLNPNFIGDAVWAREPGVAINGVKFEPETAERVTCSSGEQYKLEAFQDLADLGFDFNNAHVQPDGTYHYHGVPPGLVEAFDDGGDLVHVAFAADGHLIHYSKSGMYSPSYTLDTEKRSGTGCTFAVPGGSTTPITVNVRPDGSYVSDWLYKDGLGQLDECNGTIINGTYAYLLTDVYPYVPRCLMGEFSESLPAGTDSQNSQPPVGSGPPPR